MKVEIRRAGGFAGGEEKLASAESSQMPKAGADELRGLLARLSAWCAQHPGSAGADRFRYEIEIVEDGAEPRTLTVVDEGNPADPGLELVQSLLDLLGARR